MPKDKDTPKGETKGLTVIQGGKQEEKKKTKVRTRVNPETGLTEKMERFARAVAEGENFSDAYRKAYVTDSMGEKAIWQEGSKLAADPRVTERITALVARMEADALHDATKTRTFVLQRLRHEAEHGDSSAARIRAVELLGKLDTVGMFRERVEQEVRDRDPAEVEQALRDKLAKVLGTSA